MPPHKFELRPVRDGFELSGGPLDKPLVFHEEGMRQGMHMAGFLSQLVGGELRIFNAVGELIETRTFEPEIVMPGAIGGLRGPSF
jgi:hypothetical protein